MSPSIIAFFLLTVQALTLPANPSTSRAALVQEVVVVTKYVYVGCSTSALSQLPSNSSLDSSLAKTSIPQYESQSIEGIQVQNQSPPYSLAIDLTTFARPAEPTSDLNESKDLADQLNHAGTHQQRPAESYQFTLHSVSWANVEESASNDGTTQSSSTRTDLSGQGAFTVAPVALASIVPTLFAAPTTESKLKKTVEDGELPFRSIVTFGDNLRYDRGWSIL